jgi:uncharacterized protein YjbI with pentapeptide repeats
LQETDFSGAHFNEESSANFSYAFFSGVNFDTTKFQEARFISSKLIDSTFRGTEFEKANFNKTEFYKVNFHGARFQDAQFYSTVFSYEGNFESVLFTNQEGIIFTVKDLSKVSFMNTDISKIRFGTNISWGRMTSSEL